MYQSDRESSLLYDATQVVAGTNHFMVWELANGDFACTTIWERLPAKDGTRALQLTQNAVFGNLRNACHACGAVGENLEICATARLTHPVL